MDNDNVLSCVGGKNIYFVGRMRKASKETRGERKKFVYSSAFLTLVNK